MIKSEQNNIYYNRLIKLRTKPLYIFLAVTFCIYLIEIGVLYMNYIPSFLVFIQDTCSSSVEHVLASSFNKIVLGLSIWALFFFMMLILLIYTVWNIGKFLQFTTRD